MHWETSARCLSHDPEIFFDPRSRSERQAKAICARCDVRSDCLAFALESRAEFGVWGGLNVKERRALVRSGMTVEDGSERLQLATASA